MDLAFTTPDDCPVCDFSNVFGEIGLGSFRNGDDIVIVDICPYCHGIVQYLFPQYGDRTGHQYLHIYGNTKVCETTRKIVLGART